jgi:pilus assembly protein CpaF
VKPTDALVDVRRSLHQRMIGRVDPRQLDAMPRAERRLRVREEALTLLREQGHMLPQNALADVVNAVSDAVVGMGPIEFLLKDPEVTEVMVNGPDDVYVERKGRIERVGSAGTENAAGRGARGLSVPFLTLPAAGPWARNPGG